MSPATRHGGGQWSCTILPLFAGIWERGTGLGPAKTLLLVGPAVNILALTYTGALIGMDMAVARAALAVTLGVLMGEQVVCSGRVPSLDEVVCWVEEAAAKAA